MYRTYLSFLFLLLILSGCGVDRNIDTISKEELATLNQFYQLDGLHQVALAPIDEPGQVLHLALTFVEKGQLIPLLHQPVAFYHTSATGEYEPIDLNDESTARLSGQATTDKKGRILIRTILPGDYGSSADTRHIHMTVSGAHPEAYDLHFKQYTSAMGKRFISGSDQHFLVDLKKDSLESLVGFHTIEVKSPQGM